MSVKLYLDEDSSDTDLLSALRSRGIDVEGVQEARTRGRSDLEQVHWATAHERALYTANVAHFYALHCEFMRSGQSHYGIIFNPRQRYSVGEQLKRLLRLSDELSTEEMRNRVEFLSNWS